MLKIIRWKKKITPFIFTCKSSSNKQDFFPAPFSPTR